ncbi:four helix bundle protein [Aquirufa sp. ROCK2-A2]
MKNQNVQNKSLNFARDIYLLSKKLDNKKEFIISNQILRSGTSIGANLQEGYFAESHKDYIHKLSISLKELNETIFWLDLLQLEEIVEKQEVQILKNNGIEIMKILVTIINKLKLKI